MLDQFERMREADAGQDLREQSLQDREASIDERARHNRVNEQIAAAHLDIAAEQEEARQHVQAVAANMALQQAQDIKSAATAMQHLNPRSADYAMRLAKITGDYPFAFTKSANGLEEGLIKSITSMNEQNQIWAQSEASHQVHREQLFNNFVEKGGVALDSNGKPTNDSTQFDLTKSRTNQAKAVPPANMTVSERVTTDPVTGERVTYKSAEPKMPSSVLTKFAYLQGQIAQHEAQAKDEEAENIKANKAGIPYKKQNELAGFQTEANTLKQRFPGIDQPVQDSPASSAAGANQDQPPVVKDKSGYDTLSPGTVFTGPDGKRYTKPAQ